MSGGVAQTGGSRRRHLPTAAPTAPGGGPARRGWPAIDGPPEDNFWRPPFVLRLPALPQPACPRARHLLGGAGAGPPVGVTNFEPEHAAVAREFPDPAWRDPLQPFAQRWALLEHAMCQSADRGTLVQRSLDRLGERGDATLQMLENYRELAMGTSPITRYIAASTGHFFCHQREGLAVRLGRRTCELHLLDAQAQPASSDDDFNLNVLHSRAYLECRALDLRHHGLQPHHLPALCLALSGMHFLRVLNLEHNNLDTVQLPALLDVLRANHPYMVALHAQSPGPEAQRSEHLAAFFASPFGADKMRLDFAATTPQARHTNAVHNWRVGTEYEALAQAAYRWQQRTALGAWTAQLGALLGAQQAAELRTGAVMDWLEQDGHIAALRRLEELDLSCGPAAQCARLHPNAVCMTLHLVARWCPNLRRLDLRAAPLGDTLPDSLLATLPALGELRSLLLDGRRLSAAQRQALREVFVKRCPRLLRLELEPLWEAPFEPTLALRDHQLGVLAGAAEQAALAQLQAQPGGGLPSKKAAGLSALALEDWRRQYLDAKSQTFFAFMVDVSASLWQRPTQFRYIDWNNEQPLEVPAPVMRLGPPQVAPPPGVSAAAARP